MKNSLTTKPFLKWAGGKSQLIEQIVQNLPEELEQGKINRYIEPFVGGGAVFLYIAQLGKVKEFFICDINPELILAYKTIKTNVEDLIERLSRIQGNYLSLDMEERKRYFYQIRSQFNLQRQQINVQTFHPDWIERTAYLIFLNRTCFNGLFRVNSKGEFNVPVGRYKNPKICHAENLRSVAQILQNTQIYYGDFTISEAFVDHRSLVYFDPPYYKQGGFSDFNRYTPTQFREGDHFRLAALCRELDQRGIRWLLSNSDTSFVRNLFAGFNLKKIEARRDINLKSKRRAISELLICNY